MPNYLPLKGEFLIYLLVHFSSSLWLFAQLSS